MRLAQTFMTLRESLFDRAGHPGYRLSSRSRMGAAHGGHRVLMGFAAVSS
jgi:hypothetical protein